MKLTWKDPRAIAEELYDENPDLDPLTISFEKMHAMIVALPDFDDDGSKQRKNTGSHPGRLDGRKRLAFRRPVDQKIKQALPARLSRLKQQGTIRM